MTPGPVTVDKDLYVKALVLWGKCECGSKLLCKVFRTCKKAKAALYLVSGPGTPCVGTRCSSFASGPALCVGAPALFVSGPGALSIGLRRSLAGCVWSPDCFCIGGALQRFLCRGGAALFVSGPGILCWAPSGPQLHSCSEVGAESPRLSSFTANIMSGLTLQSHKSYPTTRRYFLWSSALKGCAS